MNSLLPSKHFVSLVLLTTLNFAAGCASGSAIRTGEWREPTSESEVQVLSSAPAEYSSIGMVRAASGSGMTEQGDYDYAVEELKAQAAKLGANAVILNSAQRRETVGPGTYYPDPNGYGGTYVPTTVSEAELSGEAIFVPE